MFAMGIAILFEGRKTYKDTIFCVRQSVEGCYLTNVCFFFARSLSLVSKMTIGARGGKGALGSNRQFEYLGNEALPGNRILYILCHGIYELAVGAGANLSII